MVPVLLTPNIRIEVIKRVRINRVGRAEIAVREISLGTADIRGIKQEAEGITHLSGVVRAGQPGRENSWAVNGMVDVQVSLTLILYPKDCMNLTRSPTVCHPLHCSTTKSHVLPCVELADRDSRSADNRPLGDA